MKVLMLVNWKVEYCKNRPEHKQPPNFYVEGEEYWFYRYFKKKTEVDVLDIRSFSWLERFEKEKLRFYVWQALKAIPKARKYDLIVSHGMQSGIVLSLWRRLFKTKAKHIVFDIGSFNSAAESGFALKLMQFASKSVDGIIYHTSSQINYYRQFFSWLTGKSRFIRFGTDLEFFDPSGLKKMEDSGCYIICVGYIKRDWETLIAAYRGLDTDVKLRLVGHVEEMYSSIPGVEQLPYVPIRELVLQIYNARFCVLPLESFNYSYGQMTLLQQMALGKCVIAARVPSLVDYIEDKKTAIMYEPKDVSDLRHKIKECLEGEVDVKKIGSDASNFLDAYCNERTMAKTVESFYHDICGEG